MGEGKGLACPEVLGLWDWGEYPSFSSHLEERYHLRVGDRRLILSPAPNPTELSPCVLVACLGSENGALQSWRRLR